MNKHVFFELAICLCFFTTQAIAQSPRKLHHFNGQNVIKADLSAAFQRELSLSYERQLSKWLTWESGLSYINYGEAPRLSGTAATSTYTEYVKRETVWFFFIPSSTTTRHYIGSGRPMEVPAENTYRMNTWTANSGLRFYFKPALIKRAIPQGFYSGLSVWGGQERFERHYYENETSILETDSDLDIYGIPIILVGLTSAESTTTYQQTVKPASSSHQNFIYGVKHSLGWQWIAPSGFTLELQTALGVRATERSRIHGLATGRPVNVEGHIKMGWAF
ncbi:MAG: hypothetical protein HUU34_05490 [Saprospiraceae bacterium]|jgi:hypothetical protein|nr:hypothetical protein [Saprospiraceae bacterium]